MDINRANLDALFRTYTTAFQQGLAYVPPMAWGELATTFPSATASNFYAWMERIPGFREWLGDRVLQNLRSKTFELVNRDWEDAVRMPAKDIEDDQYGVYGPIIQMMGESWQELQYELVMEVLYLNKTAFDGSALFYDTRTYGSNTIDNLTTAALSAATLEAAFLAAAAWKFSNDKPCRTNFTHLVVGPKLRETAWNLVVNEYIIAETTVGGTKQNANRGRAKLLISDLLVGSYDDYWFLLDCSKPVKPIALQIRKTPAPLMDTDPATVARSGFLDFLADGRAAAGPTFPHLAYAGLVS